MKPAPLQNQKFSSPENPAQLPGNFEKYDKLKKEFEDFSYIISHDLQAPLRRIVSYSSLLCENYEAAQNEKTKKYFKYVTESSLQMQDMLQSLLVYSRLSSRTAPFVKASVSDLIAGALTRCNARIIATNAVIHPLPSMSKIFCDREQIIQAFTALLDNALKFQVSGARPEIRIEESRGQNNLIISIRDNGIGLNHTKSEEIFQIFRRLNRAEDYPGLGMGLAMVKKIMERHGSSIKVESEPGKGSIFHLEFLNGADHER